MKEPEYILNKLKYLEEEKRRKTKEMKVESKLLTDIHSLLRMKNLVDSWIELNFESEIIYKTFLQ